MANSFFLSSRSSQKANLLYRYSSASIVTRPTTQLPAGKKFKKRWWRKNTPWLLNHWHNNKDSLKTVNCQKLEGLRLLIAQIGIIMAKIPSHLQLRPIRIKVTWQQSSWPLRMWMMHLLPENNWLPSWSRYRRSQPRTQLYRLCAKQATVHHV